MKYFFKSNDADKYNSESSQSSELSSTSTNNILNKNIIFQFDEQADENTSTCIVEVSEFIGSIKVMLLPLPSGSLEFTQKEETILRIFAFL